MWLPIDALLCSLAKLSVYTRHQTFLACILFHSEFLLAALSWLSLKHLSGPREASFGKWAMAECCHLRVLSVVCTCRLLSTFRYLPEQYLEMKMLNVEAGCYTSACFCQGQDLPPYCPEFMLSPQHSLHGTGMHSSAGRSQRGKQSCVQLEDLLQPAPRSGCSVNKDWALGTWVQPFVPRGPPGSTVTCS